jgi:kinetochor protein Mis14/NSL1
MPSSPSKTTSTLTHRKIDLQSPHDLTHLHATALSSVQAKLDAAFPPTASGASSDAVRARVQALIEAFVTDTFAAAKQNIAVNGMDADQLDLSFSSGDLNGHGPVKEEYEPLDAKMVERVRTLEAQREALVARVAEMRRTAPALAATQWQHEWRTEMEREAQQWKQKEGTSTNLKQDQRLELELERLDEVQRTWLRGAEGLVGLKAGLTETVGKLEEARKVVEHLDEHGEK